MNFIPFPSLEAIDPLGEPPLEGGGAIGPTGQDGPVRPGLRPRAEYHGQVPNEDPTNVFEDQTEDERDDLPLPDYAALDEDVELLLHLSRIGHRMACLGIYYHFYHELFAWAKAHGQGISGGDLRGVWRDSVDCLRPLLGDSTDKELAAVLDEPWPSEEDLRLFMGWGG